MSKLIDLMVRANAAKQQVEANVGRARAEAVDVEDALIEQIRETVRKKVDAQVKVTKTESAKLERELMDEIRESVAASVDNIDFKPLLRDTLEPGLNELKEEVRKGAFIDRSAAMQKAMEAMADRVVAAVSKSVAAIPRQDLKPLLKEVRDAVGAIKFPALMVVTKWDVEFDRDANGLMMSPIRIVADEWSEI